jgi:hypothetical protein
MRWRMAECRVRYVRERTERLYRRDNNCGAIEAYGRRASHAPPTISWVAIGRDKISGRRRAGRRILCGAAQNGMDKSK